MKNARTRGDLQGMYLAVDLQHSSCLLVMFSLLQSLNCPFVLPILLTSSVPGFHHVNVYKVPVPFQWPEKIGTLTLALCWKIILAC